ncbi:SAS complex subunit [Taxawa tesnikishii (nom. ined.)]|nr:SAS complex subunit [Dothideales sp. JES 119]
MAAMTSSSPLGRPNDHGNAKRPPMEPNVANVVLGNVQIKPWYPSFYPEEIQVCSHKDEPPPGMLLYEKDQYAIYELDGEEDKLYAQNLSLFAKLFLDTKSVFYDVSTFRYYILTQTDPSTSQQQIVGFFSKEKMSWDNNNVACILVFPPWQKRGLGQILMGVSYELGRKEGRLGGPERPLSTLGRKAYLAYWSAAISRCILAAPAKRSLTIRDIVRETWILPEDVVAALKEMAVFEADKDANGAVLVNKARVKVWAEANGVSAAALVDSAAFVEGFDDGGSDGTEAGS